MHIYIPELKLKNGKAIDYQFAGQLEQIYDDFSAGGTLDLKLSASSSGDKVLVSGSLAVAMEADCSRCLERFTNHFRSEFREAFTILRGYSEDESPAEQAVETANMLTVSGDYLYLDEYIRQLIILAQEYNPTCKPDCRGLCPRCGADLNKGNCSCNLEDHQIDARLLKLKEIKQGS